ncbi:MAG: hypothetical protein ACO3F2_05575 [Roseiflexaceae bacterium]
MTALYRDQRQCAICTTYTTFTCINSKFVFDDLDMDGRPYDMSLIVLPYWVQHCSKCHVCSSDIRIASEQAHDIIKTHAYLGIIADQSFPYLTREYNAASYLCRFAHDYANAGWHALRATWKCEDTHHPLRGVVRQQAIDNFLQAIEKQQAFASTPSEQHLIIADLYRRHGEFILAHQYNQRAAQLHPNDAISAALKIQLLAIGESNLQRLARPSN